MKRKNEYTYYINATAGESLALRALRRYLLDQVEECLANQTSIYTKDRSGGKCSVRGMM